MAFHRFKDPTYWLGESGSFPGALFGKDYDRVNIISEGTGSGGSAYADGKKVGGPNAGTYFTAFGEDATSSNFNRGFRALAENTDYLDNLFHRDILAVDAGDILTTSPGQNTVVLKKGTYVGDGSLEAKHYVTICEPGILGYMIPFFPMTDNVGNEAQVTGVIPSGTFQDGFLTQDVTVPLTIAIPRPTYSISRLVRSNLAVFNFTSFLDVYRGIVEATRIAVGASSEVQQVTFNEAYRNVSLQGFPGYYSWPSFSRPNEEIGRASCRERV